MFNTCIDLLLLTLVLLKILSALWMCHCENVVHKNLITSMESITYINRAALQDVKKDFQFYKSTEFYPMRNKRHYKSICRLWNNTWSKAYTGSGLQDYKMNNEASKKS